MLARPLSRILTTTVAAGALSFALTAPALARPDTGNCSCGGARVPQQLTTKGTDVAAPDQQNPIPAQTRPVAQPAPTWPLHPEALTAPRAAAPSVDAGFQWGDAGIGAGGALAVVLVGLGGTLLVRRRGVSDPPVPA
jgi:hypothetical protein